MKSDICLIRSDLELSRPDFILDISVSILSWIVSIVVNLFNRVQQIILDYRDGNHRNIYRMVYWKVASVDPSLVYSLEGSGYLPEQRQQFVLGFFPVAVLTILSRSSQFSINQIINNADHSLKWLKLRVLWEIDRFPIVRIPLLVEGEGWLLRKSNLGESCCSWPFLVRWL